MYSKTKIVNFLSKQLNISKQDLQKCCITELFDILDRCGLTQQFEQLLAH